MDHLDEARGATQGAVDTGFTSEVEQLRARLGPLTPQQIRIWRDMTPARRIDLACQAYHMVLEAVRVSERRRHPDDSPEELAWRVTRRMQGDRRLGR